MSICFVACREIPGLESAFPDAPARGIVLAVDGRTVVDRVLALNAEVRLDPSGARVLPASVDVLVTTVVDAVDGEALRRLRAACPRLRLIANFGVGYNNIDVGCATDLEMRVTNTPGVLTDATADLALALLLIVTRRLAEGLRIVDEEKGFSGWTPTYLLGSGVQGKTLGIVGYGAIGRAFGQRCSALGMQVVALESLRGGKDPHGDVPRLAEGAFLESCDVLSLHCPLTAATRSWLDARRIARMKSGAVVLNTARGDIIDEQALAEALESGHLAGAGLDVFRDEPVLSPALRHARNLVVLPHLGSATVETRAAMGRCVRAAVKALALGEAVVPNQVNVIA